MLRFCSLQTKGKMQTVKCRLVSIMPNENEARQFLQDLNQIHPSFKFAMELENNGVLPFLGIQLINKSPNN